MVSERKDIRISENEDIGDFVKCTGCDFGGLVSVGTENCPDCNEPTLQWVDEEEQELSRDAYIKKYPDVFDSNALPFPS